MRRAVDVARRRGVDWIVLFCNRTVEPFYAQFGFAVVDHELRITRPDGTTAARRRDDLCMVMVLGDTPWPTETLQLDIDDF